MRIIKAQFIARINEPSGKQRFKEILIIGFAVVLVVGLMVIGIYLGIEKKDVALGVSLWALSISFAASFYQFILDVIFKPVLSVRIHPNPPDFHKQKIRLDPLRNEYFSAYYFAMRIWNYGRVKAENVRVKLVRIHKQVGNNWQSIDQLNPDILLWRLNADKNYEPTIHPGTFEQCNIGLIYDPDWRRKFVQGENLPEFEKDPNYSPTSPIFHVQVSVESHNLPHLLVPGHYILEIEVSCSNGNKALKRKLELSFTHWTENESEMLRQWIFIRPFKGEIA